MVVVGKISVWKGIGRLRNSDSIVKKKERFLKRKLTSDFRNTEKLTPSLKVVKSR